MTELLPAASVAVSPPMTLRPLQPMPEPETLRSTLFVPLSETPEPPWLLTSRLESSTACKRSELCRPIPLTSAGRGHTHLDTCRSYARAPCKHDPEPIEAHVLRSSD